MFLQNPFYRKKDNKALVVTPPLLKCARVAILTNQGPLSQNFIFSVTYEWAQ
jgi:hypothetical protein